MRNSEAVGSSTAEAKRLKQLFDAAGARYAELREAAEGAIVRREWGDFDRHSIEPYYFERNRFGRGRLIDAPIGDTKGLVEHGFDAAGRLLCVRSYSELPRRQILPGGNKERPAKEVYYVYRPGEVEGILYDHSPGKAVINVAIFSYDEGRLVRLVRRFKTGKLRVEALEWQGARLASTHTKQGDEGYTQEFLYDDVGELQRIEWIDPLGNRSQIFRRVLSSPEDLFARTEELLLGSVRQCLASVSSDSPAAAVALWLDMEAFEHVLPPQLAILTEDQRTELLADHGNDAGTYLYNPVEWEEFEAEELELEGEELARVASDANQLIWQRSLHEDARDVVDRVCKALNTAELAELLSVTDDCVIFPVDITSGDGEEGVRRVATPEQLTALKRQGLIRVAK